MATLGSLSLTSEDGGAYGFRGVGSTWGLTNVRDFPVPRRHRRARIGLRDQSLQEGKSHEHSVYGWNRLGKECVFSPWRRCRRSGHDPSDGGAGEAYTADRPPTAVFDWHGGVLRSP